MKQEWLLGQIQYLKFLYLEIKLNGEIMSEQVFKTGLQMMFLLCQLLSRLNDISFTGLQIK